MISHMYVIILLFIGSSGDVFPNLSAGSHSINVRFTPDGYCQPLMQELTLNFTISTPVQSKSSNFLLMIRDNSTYV